jgi:hypothetical protein
MKSTSYQDRGVITAILMIAAFALHNYMCLTTELTIHHLGE